jgi:tetratricopeptide (TPR) repeat protein
MRKTILTAALAAALLCTSLPLTAATPGEFYSSLLRRGVAAFDAGRYEEASRHLRYAAFGYVDSIEPYQTAQVYLTLTHDRLGEQDRAREAVQRVLQAERIERRYARIPIPAAVRTAFEKVAARLVTAAELAALRGTGELPPAPPVQTTLRTTTTGSVTQPVQPPARPTPAITTTTTTQPPVTVDRIEVEVVKPQPQQTQPQRATQQPAITTQPTPPPRQQTQPTVSSTQPARTPAVTTQRGTNNTPSTSTSTSTAVPRPAAPAAARPAYSASELATRFANAERALTTANLTEARRIYRELLASGSSADHDTAVRIAEGFYRARDFAGALAAFERAGTLRRGEEPYRYYVAVALYETAQYERAKRELAAALPYIEVTADVERYRLKIQSAVQ